MVFFSGQRWAKKKVIALGFAQRSAMRRLFVYNYGHLFMYWDWALGTYRPGMTAFFGKGNVHVFTWHVSVLRWAMELVQWIISLGEVTNSSY